MVTSKIHTFDASLFEETPNRVILRFGNHFYHECFLQFFKGCSIVSALHLNYVDNEVGNELQS